MAKPDWLETRLERYPWDEYRKAVKDGVAVAEDDKLIWEN